MSNWTIARITESCIKYCKMCGVTFSAPVKINGRLTRTLGRCNYTSTCGYCVPTSIEISKQFLESTTDESIEAVIAHECAHYVTLALTHEHHGHDKVFKSFCAQMGCSNDAAIAGSETIHYTASEETLYKYAIYCEKCGKYLGHRSRACAITTYPQNYLSQCCGSGIKIVQNW